MDLKIVILSEASHTEKQNYHKILLICEIFLKRDTNELVYKIEIELQM